MPKEPQDHKSKATAESTKDAFEFAHDGVTYESVKGVSEVITPGFIRRNRRRDEMDFYFTMLEHLFDGAPEALDALDSMQWSDLKTVTEALEAHMQLSLGASLGK